MKIPFFIVGILLLTAPFLCSQTDRNGSQYAIIPSPTYPADTMELPDWLTTLYPDTVRTPFQLMKQKILYFNILNDSVSYVTYHQMNQVCTRTYLGLIKNRKEIKKLEIGEICDRDLLARSYSWKYFQLRPTNQLRTYQITESFSNSIVDRNERMETESKDTTKHVFLILQTGEIKEKK